MVLYKRKPVQLVPAPVIDDDSQEVWLISETNEIFTNYENYLARVDFYKQKRFICEITGHSNLNFFEALRSELAGSKDVDENFPEALKEPVLRKVQFQTISRVDNLVDHLFDLFKQDFYPGETVMAFLPNGDRTEAIIREKSRFPELRNSRTGELDRRAYACYVVKLPNRNDAEVNLNDEQLVRDRKVFTKAMLRSFIKNTVSREAWTGAPWIVKEQYAKRYKIDQTVPPNLLRGLTPADRKAALARRKEQEHALMVTRRSASESATPADTGVTSTLDIRPIPAPTKSHKSKTQQAALRKGSECNTPVGSSPEREVVTSRMPAQKVAVKEARPAPAPKPAPPPVIKYPIEDLDIPCKVDGLIRPRLNFITDVGPTLAHKPITNELNSDTVHALLETWVFLNVYCEPFLLDSFTFDDYLDAILFRYDDVDCELFVEIHCSLLKGLVGEGENGKIEISLPELPDIEEDDNDSDNEELESPKGNRSANDKIELSGKRKTKRFIQDEDIEMQDDPDGDNSHRASELFEDGYDWISRLRRRDFRRGGWEVIVVGLLDHLSASPKYAPTVEHILAHLVPVHQEPTLDSVRNQYLTLDPNDRIVVLQILVDLTYEASVVRRYMDECSETMTEYRKKKIEHQRARKALIEELRGYEDERKVLLPDNLPPVVASPELSEPNVKSDADSESRLNGSDEEDDLEETGDDVDNRRSLRRGDERANARKRKREEEKEKAEAAANKPKISPQFQRVLKNIERTKAKIVKEEEEIAIIDEDLRQADCARLKMLGKDRFFNRYWWFERNGMPFGGLPDSSTADSGYANGRLWIQGPSDMERVGFLEDSSESLISGDAMDIDSKPIIMARKQLEEGGTSLTHAHQFGFYETPDELTGLIAWLDPRGERELKLKKELELYRKKITEGMEQRKKYLSSAEEASMQEVVGSRMSTRGKAYVDSSTHRCLKWHNSMALAELGHTHYDHPIKKAKNRKSGGVTDDKAPLNRNGKPIGRQGTRYNF